MSARGKVGASRAIQAAVRDATGRSPAALAAVLAAVINEGDPLRDLHPLFDLPAYPAGTSVSAVAAFPGCRGSGRGAGAGGAAGTGRVVPAVRRVAPTGDRPSVAAGTGAVPHPGCGAVSTGQPVRAAWSEDPAQSADRPGRGGG